MSNRGKIMLLVAIAVAIGAFIIISRRKASAYTSPYVSPSQTQTAVSSGTYGSEALSIAQSLYGSIASGIGGSTPAVGTIVQTGDVFDPLAAQVAAGTLSADQAQAYYNELTYVPASTGPATSTRSGRGHF